MVSARQTYDQESFVARSSVSFVYVRVLCRCVYVSASEGMCVSVVCAYKYA
jgi:hypothetical protein